MTTLDPKAAPAVIQSWLRDVRPDIDATIDAHLALPSPDPGRLVEAMRYAALGPGKRLRPALTVAACAAVGGARARALPAAAAIEMLHAYTLVHDDLPCMDDDDERRGRPTVHVEFGEAVAVLAGDGLLTAAFGALAALGPDAAAAIEVLARRAGALELLAGQARDLSLQDQPEALAALGFGEVETIHAAKTGALFSAATELGAIAGAASADQRRALADFGMAIGVAFQHADDRDDGDFVAHAERARARMQALTTQASDIAASFGDRGDTLAAVAEWMRARA